MQTRHSRKSLNPMQSFHLPRHSDGADYSVNAEEWKVLQDLSLAARRSVAPTPSAQPILPDDSNVSTGKLRRMFPDDSQWYKRLDKTFHAPTSPRTRQMLRRSLSQNVSSSSVVTDEESSMPAPRGRKLFKKKKKLFMKSDLEKALDDTAFTDEPSGSNETSRNLSNVSVASRRSSRLGKLATAATSATSPVESPRQTIRRVLGENRLSARMQNVRKSLGPTIAERNESEVSQQEPSPSKASLSPPRREHRSWTKSRPSRGYMMPDEEEEDSPPMTSSFVAPTRAKKLFSRKNPRRSFGAVLNDASSLNGSAELSGSMAKSNRTVAEEKSVVERRKPSKTRGNMRASFGGLLDAAESTLEASEVSEMATDNLDESEESEISDSEERSIRRKPFAKATHKNRSPVAVDLLQENSFSESAVTGECDCTPSPVGLKGPERKSENDSPAPEHSDEDQPSPPAERRTPFARKSRRSTVIASAIEGEFGESQDPAEDIRPNSDVSAEDQPSPPAERRALFARKSRRSSAVTSAIEDGDLDESQGEVEAEEATNRGRDASQKHPPSPLTQDDTLLVRKSRVSAAESPMVTVRKNLEKAALTSLSSLGRRSQAAKSPAQSPAKNTRSQSRSVARPPEKTDSSSEKDARSPIVRNFPESSPKQTSASAKRRSSSREKQSHETVEKDGGDVPGDSSERVPDEERSFIEAVRKKRWADKREGNGVRRFDLDFLLDTSSSVSDSAVGNTSAVEAEPDEATSAVEEAPRESDFVAPTNIGRSLSDRLAATNLEKLLVVIPRLTPDAVTSTPTPSGTKMLIPTPLSSVKNPLKDSPQDEPAAQSPGKNTRSRSSGAARPPEKPDSSSEDARSPIVRNPLESPPKRTSTSANRRSSRMEERSLKTAEERTSERKRRSRSQLSSSGSPDSTVRDGSVARSSSSVVSNESKQRSGGKLKTAPRQPLFSLKRQKSVVPVRPIFDDALLSSESEEGDDERLSVVSKRKSAVTDDSGPRKKSRVNETAELMKEDQVSVNYTASAISLNPSNDFMTMVSEAARPSTFSLNIISRRSPVTAEDVQSLINALRNTPSRGSGSRHSDISEDPGTPEKTSKRRDKSLASAASGPKTRDKSSRHPDVSEDLGTPKEPLENSPSRRKSLVSVASSLKRKTPQSSKRRSNVSEDLGTPEIESENSPSRRSKPLASAASSLNKKTPEERSRRSNVSEDLEIPEGTLENSPPRRSKSLNLTASSLKRKASQSSNRRSTVSEDVETSDQSLDGSPTPKSARKSRSSSACSVEDNLQANRGDPGTAEDSAENTPPRDSGRVPASSLKKKTPTSEVHFSVPDLPIQRKKSAVPTRVRNADIRTFFQKSTPLRESQSDDTPDHLLPLDATIITPIKKTSGFNGERISDKSNEVNLKTILNKLQDWAPRKADPPTPPEQSPAQRRPMRAPAKATLKPAGKKFQLILPNGEVYKAPKLLKPKKFVSDKMYRFITKRIENNTNLDSRVRAEKFVKRLCDTYTKVLARKKTKDLVNDLLKEMVRLGLVSTYSEFYHFVEDFMPYSFRMKAIPCIGKDLAPEPLMGIYEKLVYTDL